MKKLVLAEKTGFSTLLPFKIYDSTGFLFYSDTFVSKIREGKRLFFNLPIGEYQYNGIFEKLPNPVSREKRIEQINKELPPPERKIPNTGYRIEWGNNPNKCSIFYDQKRILFDKSLAKIPMYMKFYIYFHEMGHHLYKTEKFADLFAAKKMLQLGFNASQIGYSSLETLSDKQKERKEFLVNNLTS